MDANAMVEDGRPGVCLVSDGDVGGAAYVDYYAIVGHCREDVDRVCDAVSDILTRRGLVVHSLTRADRLCTFTGFTIDGPVPLFRVKPARLWRLKHGLDAAIQRGWLNGAGVEILLGHIIWAMMARREALSILSSCYAFIAVARTGRRRLWPAVFRTSLGSKHLVLALLPWLALARPRGGDGCVVVWRRRLRALGFAGGGWRSG